MPPILTLKILVLRRSVDAAGTPGDSPLNPRVPNELGPSGEMTNAHHSGGP